MFNTILYVDNEKLKEYNSILVNKPTSKFNSRTIEKKGKIGNSIIAGEEKVIDSIDLESNINYEYFKFEQKAKEEVNEEYFFDFTDNDYDINTITCNSLVKLRAIANVPEEFDTSKMLDEYANVIIKSLEDTPNVETFANMLEKRQVKIPIIAQDENGNYFMKIDMNKIKVDYEEFENLEDDEIVIVGKIIRKKSESVEIYNPYKDFLKIPRKLRRTMTIQPSNNFDFEPIIRDEPFYELEVLAIYR